MGGIEQLHSTQNFSDLIFSPIFKTSEPNLHVICVSSTAFCCATVSAPISSSFGSAKNHSFKGKNLRFLSFEWNTFHEKLWLCMSYFCSFMHIFIKRKRNTYDTANQLGNNWISRIFSHSKLVCSRPLNGQHNKFQCYI